MTDDGLLIAGATTTDLMEDFTLHSSSAPRSCPKPAARVAATAAVYQRRATRCRSSTRFGLEGKNNECGGIYSIKDPDVNMCLPPLAWQTYDIDSRPPASTLPVEQDQQRPPHG